MYGPFPNLSALTYPILTNYWGEIDFLVPVAREYTHVMELIENKNVKMAIIPNADQTPNHNLTGSWVEGHQ